MSAGTVLLVEDDHALGDALADAMVDEGWRVDRAHTVAEAHEALRQSQPDVVVLDYLVGGENTRGVLAHLAARADSPPVLMLSAASAASEVAESFRISFLPKPCELDALFAALRAALRPTGPG